MRDKGLPDCTDGSDEIGGYLYAYHENIRI